jgi:hypothetical protein
MEQNHEIKYKIDLNQKKFEQQVEIEKEKIEPKKAKKYVSEIFFFCLKSKFKF